MRELLLCPVAEATVLLSIAADPTHASIAYGLESYFVPQGEGRRIETTPKARIEVVAAVAGDGTAAIKRLLIDGKLVYAEPPY